MSQSFKFLRPVYLGDEVTVTVTVSAYRPDRAILTLDAAVRNQRGEKVLGGEAVCLVEDVLKRSVRDLGSRRRLGSLPISTLKCRMHI